MPDPYLALAGLTKAYGAAAPVVRGLSLDVAAGEFVTLLGPSGCGKTTTLRMVAGLVAPTAGRIAVAGADITGQPVHRRNMGVVFQSYALFPHMSVAANVAFGLQMRGLPRAEARPRVREALALVRLEALAERRPAQLSGGQQQRVALARALVIRPAVLLLDEPLSNLDAKLRDELRGEIRDIQQRLGITALFVTHDQTEALTMSDRVVVMRDGQVEQIGTPAEIYQQPATAFTAAFVGRTNSLALRVAASDASGSVLEGAGGRFVSSRVLPAGTPVTAMVRPHRIRLSAAATGAANAVPAVVTRAVFAGDVLHYEVAGGGCALSVEQPAAGGALRPGDAVVVEWDAADMLAFP